MKWVRSSGNEKQFSVFNYIDTRRNILGSVDVDHSTKKIKWYVGSLNGSGRSVGHAKKVVEKSVKR